MKNKKHKIYILIICLLILLFILAICLKQSGVFANSFNWNQSAGVTKQIAVNGGVINMPDSSGTQDIPDTDSEKSSVSVAPIVSDSQGDTDTLSSKDTKNSRADNGKNKKGKSTASSSTVPSSTPGISSSKAPVSSVPEQNSSSQTPVPSSSPSSTASPSSNSSYHHSINITGITLNKSELSLIKGKSSVLTAKIAPLNTTQNKAVKWSSSNEKVAAVDSTGKVTAINAGTATITAVTSNGKAASCQVTVIVPITEITLNKSAIAITKESSQMLSTVLKPLDTTEKIVWATSDNDIAEVDNNGKITGISPGTVTITAANTGGTVKASCTVTVGISITKLSLSDTILTLKKGGCKTLTATITPENATDKTVTWTSSNEKVATVDGTGKVTAVEAGTAKITATTKDGGFTAECAVTVTIPVTGVSLNKSSLSLVKGANETLVSKILPENVTDKTVTWTSSNEKVATVDGTGKVTAVEAGTAKITATTHDGGFAAECDVTVTIPVTGVSLNKSSLSLVKGANETLVSKILPENATDKTVTWKSSNKKAATVDSTGKVTAVEAGTAIITATTHDGGFAAECDVTVTIPVTGISINKSSLFLIKGKSETLISTISPENATDKTVTWLSNNEKVATVDGTGMVTAVEAGTAKITATTKDGGFTAQCDVTVTIPVTGVSLNKSSLSLIKDKSETLISTISPENATDKTVTWSSNNEKVATVDGTGKVTAVESGTAKITATTKDGGFTAECAVTVTIPVTGVSLNKSSLSLIKGKNKILVSKILPENATDKTVTWTSSNEKVATVDSTGKVTAVEAGTAKITATTKDGGFTAECAVTVTIPVTGVSLNKSSLSLIKGKNKILVSKILPENATDKTVTWTSSNKKVATVDSTGKVTAVEAGTAKITAITKDGGFTTECAVTVTIPVTGVSLNKSSLSLIKGKSETLVSKILPENATDKAVTWSSNNKKVATVDGTGKVTAVGGGTATITATTRSGGFTAKCAVKVVIPVTGITLNQTSLSLKQGYTATLSAIITPTDATNKAVTWTSSNEKIATVSSTGYVKAVGEGQAIISAKTQSGGYTAQCSVNCIIPLKVKTYCGKLHYIKPNGSFGLEGEAGTNERARGEETVQDAITFEFSNAISYTKGSTIVSLSGLKFHYDRCYFGPRNGPFFEIYADDKLVYKSDDYYFMRDGDFEANCDGNFKKLKLKYTGIFYKGKDDHTMYPGPGYFELEVPSGGLCICGQRITNVYVES